MPASTNHKAAQVWVGFDLGGTKMLAVAVNGDFEELGRKRRKTKAHEGAPATLARIVETIRTVLDGASVAPGSVSGVGIAVPGLLDLTRGVVRNAPNLGWEDVDLQQYLADALSCPVVLINDADAGAYGEYRFGAGAGARSVCGIFPGTGIGAGGVYEGRLLRGSDVSCMEIGHCQVLPDGPICGCGKRGCLEAVASRLAMSAAAAAAALRGQAPRLLESVGTDLTNIRSKALATAIEAGDTAVEQIVRHGARWLGRGAALLINLLSPDIVIVGGGLAEAMPELYKEEVSRGAADHAMAQFDGTYRIEIARLGDDATVVGAAAWARESVGKTA